MTGGQDQLVSVRDAARQCGRNPETVRRWVWSGRLPAEKLGNQLFIRQSDLTAFCERTLAAGDEIVVDPTDAPNAAGAEISNGPRASAPPPVARPEPGSREGVIMDMRRLRMGVRALVGDLEVDDARE